MATSSQSPVPLRIGVAVWNYCEKGLPLLDLVRELATWKVETLSFLPVQIADLRPEDRPRFLRILDEHRLGVTVHGNCNVTHAQAETIVNLLGPRLLAFTLDSAIRTDSRGVFFDAVRMARVLADVRDLTRDSGTRFGVEDFPLDDLAVDFYRSDMASLFECPRFGILIDLGHMNIRSRKEDYFRGTATQEFLRRIPVPIVEIHVHDNAGDRDSHAPAGAGNVPFEETARSLVALGFSGVSTIEVAPSLHGRLPGESRPALRQTLLFWRECLGKAAAQPSSAPSGKEKHGSCKTPMRLTTGSPSITKPAAIPSFEGRGCAEPFRGEGFCGCLKHVQT